MLLPKYYTNYDYTGINACGKTMHSGIIIPIRQMRIILFKYLNISKQAPDTCIILWIIDIKYTRRYLSTIIPNCVHNIT